MASPSTPGVLRRVEERRTAPRRFPRDSGPRRPDWPNGAELSYQSYHNNNNYVQGVTRAAARATAAARARATARTPPPRS